MSRGGGGGGVGGGGAGTVSRRGGRGVVAVSDIAPTVITARSAYGSSCHALCPPHPPPPGKYGRNIKCAINSAYRSVSGRSGGPAGDATATDFYLKSVRTRTGPVRPRVEIFGGGGGLLFIWRIWDP